MHVVSIYLAVASVLGFSCFLFFFLLVDVDCWPACEELIRDLYGYWKLILFPDCYIELSATKLLCMCVFVQKCA